MLKISSAPTFSTKIAQAGGRAAGFDNLRIALAFGVVLWHAFPISYGSVAAIGFYNGPFGPAVAIILPMFFALSGFLVAGSLERNPSLIRYTSLRVLRIVPALTVEVVVSSMIVGPILTTLPLREYFSNSEFYLYFLNIVGWIHYKLPGMFPDNPLPYVVNSQLWTIPFEIKSYALLALMAAVGLVSKRRVFLLVAIAMQVALIAVEVVPRVLAHEIIPPNDSMFSGRMLVMSFLSGVAMFLYRDTLRHSGVIAAACGVLCVVLFRWQFGAYFVAFPAAYLTAYLGLLNWKWSATSKVGDFSYGVYLYSAVSQQIIASFGPWTHHWYINFTIALPLVTLFAAASWYGIERPALGLRKHLWIFDRMDAVLETWAVRARAWPRRTFARSGVDV